MREVQLIETPSIIQRRNEAMLLDLKERVASLEAAIRQLKNADCQEEPPGG